MADTILNPKFRDHQVSGNLVGDPEWKKNRANEPMAVFRLADNQKKFNRDTNSWDDAGVTFYDVAVTKIGLAENLMNSIRSGNRVHVTGTYEAVPFATPAGGVGMNHKIWADDVSASLVFNQVRVGPSVQQEKSMQAAAIADAQANAQHDAAPVAGSDTNFDASFR